MSNLNVAFAPQIERAAQRHGLDPRLLAAVAAQETGGPGASSGRNIVGDGGHGHGIFQIDDRWHAFARSSAAMDPQKNADYAAGMLASGLRQYGGDVRKTLSAYNAGSPLAIGTKTDWGDGKPIGYADSVARHFTIIARGSPGDSHPGEDSSGAPNVAATFLRGVQTALSACSSAFGSAMASAHSASHGPRRGEASAADSSGVIAAQTTSDEL